MYSLSEKPRLNVSTYDQVSGMLIAVLVSLGFVVTLMVAIWYSSRTWLPTPPVAVKVIKDVGGSGKGIGEGKRPIAEEFDEPSPEETPAAAGDAKAAETDALNAISLTAQPDVLAELTLGETSSAKGNGIGIGTGDDPRNPGPGNGPGTEIGTPAAERWEVRLNPSTMEEYARKLDYFEIELGLAGGGSPLVTYVTAVATLKPKVRTGSPKDENRLRFMHRSGVLHDADRRLVQKAGVDPGGKVVFQFYSPATYQTLLRLENEYLGNRSISEVRRTIFGVKQLGDKFEFFVISQEYR